jgi:hypothetical protein
MDVLLGRIWLGINNVRLVVPKTTDKETKETWQTSSATREFQRLIRI